MELLKKHFRHALLFLIFKETVAEGHRILIETYDDIASSIKTCEYWFRRFKSSNFNVNDKDCSRQPKKLENADL